MEEKNTLGRLYNTKEAADLLGIGIQTLYNWRHNRRGPDYVLMGSKPMYRRSAIDAYIQQQTIVLNPPAAA
jgi:excisionase family DNA binding protein